jgi:hypothetical protein
MTTARFSLAPAFLALLLAGCGSSAPKISTASVLGPEAASQAQPAPAVPVTPEQRAAQVGATSARATKCGYNFDPDKLRASFIASEMQAGTAADQMPKVEKAYDTIRASVAAAVAGDVGYCTQAKTKEIKADLSRHLAGDFNPPSQTRLAQQEKGMFGGLFDSQCASCDNKPLTADTFWDKNGEIRPRRPPQ